MIRLKDSKSRTHKSGGVVVLDGLGVTEGLQDGVSLQKLLLQLPLQHGNTQKFLIRVLENICAVDGVARGHLEMACR